MGRIKQERRKNQPKGPLLRLSLQTRGSNWLGPPRITDPKRQEARAPLQVEG